MSSTITTASIASHINEVSKRLQDHSYAEQLKKEIERQEKLEWDLISNGRTCSIASEAILSTLPGLDVSILKEKAKKGFYNPKVMEVLACLSSSVVISSNDYDQNHNERTRNWFSNLRQIGTESVSGVAISAGLSLDKDDKKSGDGLFVLKVPRNPDSPNETLHESVIGIYATNRLREEGILNYAYIYTFFQCTSTIIDPVTKKVTSWCNTDNPIKGNMVSYSVYENIEGATSMNELCETCDSKTFMQYFLQTLLALRAGKKKLDFTHYDLHGENVLIRPYSDSSFWLPYPISDENGNEGTIWILSPGGVSTFIDYGNSHVKLNINNKDEHLGHVGIHAPLIQYGVFRDRSHIMHDVYKHLCFCAMAMKRKENIKCYIEISGLIKYFNSNANMDAVLNEQLEYYFTLPYELSQAAGLNIDSFIFFVLKSYNCESFVSYQHPRNAILKCGVECLSLPAVFGEVGMDLHGIVEVPKTFLELTDYVIRYKQLYYSDKNNQRYVDILNYIIENFPLQKAFVEEVSRIEGLFNTLNKSFNLYAFPKRLVDLLDPQVLGILKEYAANVSLFLDAYQRIQIALDIHDTLLPQQAINGPNPDPVFKEFSEKLNVYSQNRREIIDLLKEQYLQLFPTDKIKEEEVKLLKDKIKYDQENQKYMWYWITFATLKVFLN